MAWLGRLHEATVVPTGTCRAIALVLLEIAQLGSALLGRLPEAIELEPVKLPLILSGVCSLSSANYFPNPFGIFREMVK